MTDDKQAVKLEFPYEWALQKILGPTFDEFGHDLAGLYRAGIEKVSSVARRKIKNIDDGALANLRVARDVFWNGGFSDEAICAEYFGGILAAARSDDGKDDSGIYYTDIVKSLSSAQLHLHYAIYRSLNKFLISTSEKSNLNVGHISEMSSTNIHFLAIELDNLGCNTQMNLEALYRRGLLHEYKIYTAEVNDNAKLPYVSVIPTTLGVQLFAVANNALKEWRQLPVKDFGDFPNIALPQHFSWNVNELAQTIGLSVNQK